MEIDLQLRRWVRLALLLLALVEGKPQFLPCAQDRSTMMRKGQSIMGQDVGAFGAGDLHISIMHSDGKPTASFVPGEALMMRLKGLPGGGAGFAAVRLNDGGGQLSAAQGNYTTALANKCVAQMFTTDAVLARRPTTEHALLTTPCDEAPEVITVTLVAAPIDTGPFFYQTATLRRAKGRSASCPPAPAPGPSLSYPFQYPLNETCPTTGAAAQHGTPCPNVPCSSPPGKHGTCLVITSWPQQIQPGRNGSIMAETRVEMLTDRVTPISHHYVTGSAPPQRAWTRDMTGWHLKVDGQVDAPHFFTMAELQAFPNVRRQYVLECASQWGRGMVPAYQQADWWSIGGVSCSEWTGVLLRDVLRAVKVNHSAVYVGYYGEDEGGLSRGVPIEKAMDGHTMLAWAMNGEPLPAFHGFPLRMLAPGFPGSAQGKWLRRLWIRDREHDGLGMRGKSYRVPKYPLRPGDYDAPDEMFKVFTQQPVRSVIVRPARCTVAHDPHLDLQGKAWSGAGEVVRVELSYDAGRHWSNTTLFPPANKWAWQEWVGRIELPYPGVWDIFVRATDHTGAMQPMVVPGWNPGGYGNNQAMKVDVELLASTPRSLQNQNQCKVCGHTYKLKKDCGGQADPTKSCGVAGVPFEQLPKEWRCPVCGALKSAYHEIHMEGSKYSLGEPPLGQQGIPFPDPVAPPDPAAPPPPSPQLPSGGWKAGPGAVVGLALAAFAAGFAMAKSPHITQFIGALAAMAGCLGAAGTAYLASPSVDTLFAGHVYFMAAFFALLTTGLNIYPICGSKGRGRSRGLHAGVQMMAAVCSAAGYVCMYRAQAAMGISQLGLDPGLPWTMLAHVWCGYLVLALVSVQMFQGWSRLLGFGLQLKHPRLGQLCYAGAATNVLLTYGFGLPGLTLGSKHSSVFVVLGLVCIAAVLTLVLSFAWKRTAAREVVPELVPGEVAYEPLSG